MQFYRKKAGLTQKQLGKLIGLSQSDISKLEHGHIINVSKKNIEELSKVLNICPYKLLFLLLKIDCKDGCFNECNQNFFK